MKEIYLHIGLGKTGTTSIQKFLSMHYDILLAEDIHYILSAGGGSGDGHQAIAKSCIEIIPDYMEVADASNDIEALKSEIAGSSCNTILLSSENFQLASPAKVKKMLNSVCDDYICRVILVVRSQDELLESEYNQMVKVKSLTQSLAQYADSYFDGDFMKLAESWEATFGEQTLSASVYDSASNDAIKDFLSTLPLRRSALERLCELNQYSVNKSLDIQGLSEQYLVNQSSELDLSKQVREVVPPELPAVLMDSEEAREFRARFHESNRLFSSKFLDVQLTNLGGTRFNDADRNRYASYWKEVLRLTSNRSW